MHELTGRVAIVTGAGRGFGRAIALRFAAEGAAVALVSRTRTQLDSVAAEIEALGGRALAVPADVTSADDVRDAVRRTVDRFGSVTDLVSNAGVPGPFGPIWNDPQKWWAAQKVHQLAPLLFLHEVMPVMTARGSGRVILVSARASRVFAPFLSAYCVGKLVQTRIAAHVANEAAAANVRVFAIDPGFVFTELAEETMSSPDAQRYLPGMAARLRVMKDSPTRDAELPLCAQRCVDLASGRYDALSGRYLELPDDLDALLRESIPSTHA
jgi:3-oxoacyl-[acyl-carrier protein] reductase